MRLRRSTVAVSSGGKGRLRLGCRRAEPAGCRSVTATLRGLRATASRPLIQAGKTVTLRFTVGRRLRRLRREGTLRARLVLGAYDQLANRGRVRKRVTLTLRD